MLIKNTLIALIGSSSICMASHAVSDDVPPPGGPYQSTQTMRIMPPQQEIPEWVKSRQQEMNKWSRELTKNRFNNPANDNSQMIAPWWVKRELEMDNRQKSMQQADKNASTDDKPLPQAWAQQPRMRMQAPQRNPYYMQQQNQQQFPANRGQYMPNVPPANYYARPVNPGAQMQRPMNHYQPMWR